MAFALSKDSFTSEAFSFSLARKPARFSEEKGDVGGCHAFEGVAVSSSSSSSPVPLVSQGGYSKGENRGRETHRGGGKHRPCCVSDSNKVKIDSNLQIDLYYTLYMRMKNKKRRRRRR